MVEEGVVSLLWTQFMMQSGHEIQYKDVVTQVSLFIKHMFEGNFSQANEDQHLAVQYYCGHLPLGESKFCDYIWRFWEMDFVQTVFFLVSFAQVALGLGLFLGVFEYQKKKAFSAV
jgi:hypothetical protein